MRRTLALLLPLALLGFAPAPEEPELPFPLLTMELFEYPLELEPAPFTIHDEIRLLEERARLSEERRQQAIEDLKDRQARLQELGWYVGQVDGIEGPLTIAAREDFQGEAGIDADGEVTDEYVKVLFSEGAPTPPPPPAPEPEPEPEPEPAPSSSPAPAATSGVPWDRIAQCESGGNWAINTGNGYYGGLQFDKSSWDWAGGTQYAAYPHEASREQQIATAEKLLAMHPAGLGAWPACTKKLGLR